MTWQNAPALAARHGGACLMTQDGELLTLDAQAARAALETLPPPLLVHAPATFRRLGLRPGPCLDLLELYAFVLPARPAAPTPRGLALALDLTPPDTLEDSAVILPDIARALLHRLAQGKTLPLNTHAAGIAARMGRAGWPWAQAVMAVLGGDNATSLDGFRPWRRLPEWEEEAAPPPGASHAVQPAESRQRLAAMLGPSAEQRPGQADYADAVTSAFQPREARGQPHLVLAEAGTGTGKTLGYIAPASLWAERNHAPVWISTYTKHLQRQIDGELARLHPDPAERRRRVVVRKGRENYLCLLNFEDAVGAVLGGGSARLIPLGLLARWVAATTDGDIMGGDLPGWFTEVFGAGVTAGLADRRGECIHGACAHYKRCFIEHTVRRARTAELVVANHALVMTQAALGGLDDGNVPTRYVFDEGHQVFEAADSAFAAEISGAEGAELRRWLLGAEGHASRARGLKRRLDDLVVGHTQLEPPLEAILQAARALPSPGWALRLSEAPLPELGGTKHGAPNPFEAFCAAVRAQVLARLPSGREPGYSEEVDTFPATDALAEAAPILSRALTRLAEPLATLIRRLEERLDEEAEELDTTTRTRIEAACRAMRRRALDRVRIWIAMLDAIGEPRPEPGERPAHIFYLRLARGEAGDRDAAFCRHFLDPTLPFAVTLAGPAHGLLVTSATLRDETGSAIEAGWEAAEARIGAPHLASPAFRASVPSPFDYASQTRTFVVTDVSQDIAALAAAYRTLFLAAGGGGLGLFTAISRLQAVHARIAPVLEQAGIPLLAQHVDPMDNATLVDIFRTEENSCLLGTDAMRDGVDVPGRALRLVVFERVPWPRPDILHRERRIHLSQGDTAGYDDRVARLRLRQAFGRLIRSAGDRGVFVLLDRRMPGRLLSAFPRGATVQRMGLAEAARETAAFLNANPSPVAGLRPPEHPPAAASDDRRPTADDR
jgi:ATP-dependent DNA helicase DinG